MTSKIHLAGLALAATAWLAPNLPAQSSAANNGANLGQLMTSWKATHGANWRLRTSDSSSYARMLFGGSAQGALTPVTNADFFSLAHSFVDDVAPMFGVSNDQLANDKVIFLPLALQGSTDKMTVRMSQEINGVPVENGSVNVLFAMDGSMLSFDARTVPVPVEFDTDPTIDAGSALNAAVQAFSETTGTPVTSSSLIELNIVSELDNGIAQPTLAWRVQLWNETEGLIPESYVYQVAAQDLARIVREDDAIHHFDVGGTVSTLASPGTRPDVSNNGETSQLAAYMTVTASGVGTTTTDVNGNFNFPGVTGPVSVTFRYNGTYNNVDNESGAEYVLTQSLTGTGNSVLMNPTASALVTAEANCFQSVNEMRDWTRRIMPSDNNMDFVNDANANISSNCNAFYDGSSTNYYTTGGGCSNTAYSTVVWHEQGHWQNDRYNSGNGFDGFGEGNSDVFAMYNGNTPLVGEEFFGQGGAAIRTGLNLRQYCGDGNGGCYGQVHADGEVLMGALWKVRANLQATQGDVAGGIVADTLFLGWMNAYDQGTIDSIIEIQWLTLDDDNGNINDSTPNWSDINPGFTVQGFPGFFPTGAPGASFTSDITTGPAPLSVSFIDTSVGNTITGWVWDFGDGGSSTLQNPTYVYASMGTYDVSLTVSNDLGSDSDTQSDYIVVTPAGPASTTTRNGTGLNPNVFTSSTLPLLGTNWISSIDGGSLGAGGLSFVFGYSSPLIPGLVLGFGELLIDPTSPSAFLNIAFITGGTATHSEPVPFDLALIGTGLATQGFLNNVGGAGVLTNAIDIIFGTF